MISNIRERLGLYGVLGLVTFLYIFQFYLVNHFVISFPNWGDELGFIDLARALEAGEVSIWQTYYPFHNLVHVCWLVKCFFWIQLKFFGVIDYKVSVFIGQLFFLPLIYVFRQYFKIQNWSILLQIGFFLLLFSLKGNIDNLGLLGILQHSTTVVCIVTAGYFSILKKNFLKAFLLTNLCLLLNSTEIIGAILLLMVMVFVEKEPRKYIYVGFSLLNLCLYYFGVKHSESLLNLQSTPMQFNLSSVVGILTFLGGLFSNTYTLLTLGIIYLLIATFSFILLPGNFSKKLSSKRFFPLFIFFSLFFIGILIQLGRSDPNDPMIGVKNSIASRFSFYHISILCAIFMMLAGRIRSDSKIMQLIFIVVPIAFYGLNIKKTWPILQLEVDRVAIDHHNFFYSQENLNYAIDTHMAQRLVASNVMVPPSVNGWNRLKRISKLEVQRKEVDGSQTIFFTIPNHLSKFVEIELRNKKHVLAPIYWPNKEEAKVKISTEWLNKNDILNMYLLQ